MYHDFTYEFWSQQSQEEENKNVEMKLDRSVITKLLASS